MLKFIERTNAMQDFPEWLKMLDDEDVQFIKRFVLASGSLKALAEEYGISYPTLRARLDRLIEKISIIESPKIKDPFKRQLEMMLVDSIIDKNAARKLMLAYKKSLSENGEGELE
jgi:hypothetical protein